MPSNLASLGVGGAGVLPASPLLTNLVAYWPINAPAQLLTDLHTNGLTLTDNGSVGAGTGLVYPGAGDFNGTNQRLGRVSSAALQMPGDQAFTITAWARLRAIGRTWFVSKYADGGGETHEYTIEYDNGANATRFYVGNGTSGTNVTLAGALALNTWLFLAAVHDPVADQLRLSLNAGTPASATWAGGTQATAAPLSLGAYAGGAFWLNGLLGPVTLHKRVLSQSEIVQLYNGGAGLAYPF